MTDISNIDVYNARMRAGIEDKLFFVPYISPRVTTIVDFGCADGTLLSTLAMRTGIKRFIGIDSNDEMLKAASREYYGAGSYSKFYHSLDEMLEGEHYPDGLANCLVLFSSVVHELVFYNSWTYFVSTLEKITSLGPEQIVIRDMAVSKLSYNFMTAVPLKVRSHPLWPSYIEHKLTDDVIKDYPDNCSSARNDNGEVVAVPQPILYEFFLKYRYAENWAREKQENYFPAPMESMDDVFLYNITGAGYETTFANHTLHEFTRQCVKLDFTFDMKVPTHYRRIFTKIHTSELSSNLQKRP